MAAQRRFKILYFTYFAALGAVLPYQVLFFERKGLSFTQIGVIGSAAAAAAIPLGLLWVNWSDRAGKRRPFIAFGFISQIALWLGISAASGFWAFLLLMLLASILVPPLEALLNVVVLAGSDETRKGTEYSLVRVWGSVGWIVSAAVGGALVQSIELRFSFFFGSALLALCVVQQFGSEPHGSGSANGRRREATRLGREVSFLAATLIRELSVGIAYAFLSIYLDKIGTPYWLLGWAWAISALPELPIMVLAGRASDRIGRNPLLIAGFACSSAMGYAYSVVRTPVLAVPLMSLSGISFGLSHIASVGFMADIAPHNRQAMAQGVYVVLTTNVPRVAGPFLGGLILDRMGLAALFSTSGTLSLISAVILAPRWLSSRGTDPKGHHEST